MTPSSRPSALRSLLLVTAMTGLITACARSTADQPATTGTHTIAVAAATESTSSTPRAPVVIDTVAAAPAAAPAVAPVMAVEPAAAAVPAELLAGTEDDVIPAQVRGAGERMVRVRLVRREGRYPLRRREEHLVRRGDQVTVSSAQEMVADHFLVTVPAGQEAALPAAITAAGCTVRRILPGGRVALAAFDYVDHHTYTNKRGDLLAKVGIRAADPDFIVQAVGTPNDSNFAQLWGMHNTGQGGGVVDADIDAVEAWDIHTGSKNVLVGVIDTGIDYNHPDLAANMWTSPGESGTDANGADKRFNGIDDDGNGYIDDWRGWDFVNGDNDPYDDHYHGTHCAGTIGGVGNNGQGVAGVCWNVSLVGLKFLDAGGYGSTSGAVEATLYATTINCTLTSNSWGGGGYSQALKDAIDAAGAAGKLFVAAAGNNSSDTDMYVNYPSAYDSANIIAVAATDRYDGLAWFSNYGVTTVDLGAPGVDVYSTAPNGGYQFLSGTSMATPHVAGACALLKSANPSLSAVQIKQALMDTVDPVAALAGRTVTGGRLNLHRAALLVSGPVLTVSNKTLVDVGNNNGILNPGETANVTITIASQGSEPLSGLVGTLSLSHPSLSITDGSVSYGTVAVGSTSAGDGPFKVKVASGIATPLVVEGLVTFTATKGGPWTTPVTIAVYTSATLSGTVKTKSGAAIAGATVSWTGASTGSVTTNASGAYSKALVAGTYQITASAPTYASSAPQTVTLPPNKTLAFTLGKPDILVAPTSLVMTANEGENTTTSMTISNKGDTMLTGTVTIPGRWTATGLWHESSYRDSGTPDGGRPSWYYGQESTRNYDTGTANSGTLTGTVLVPIANPILTFNEWRQTDTYYYWEDISVVQVAPAGTQAWTTVYQSYWYGDWHLVNVDLSAFAGQHVDVRFVFDTVTASSNHFEGWYVDDIRIGNLLVMPWLTTDTTSFSLAAGASKTVQVTAIGGPLTGGIHHGSVVLDSNDPDQPSLPVPVTITVIGQPQLTVAGATWSDLGSPAVGDGDNWMEPGETVSLYLVVKNIGSGPATNVTGVMATANPHLTVLSGWLNITDNIPPGGEVVSGPYLIAISPDCPSPSDAFPVFNGYVNNNRGWATGVDLHIETRSSLSGVAKTPTGATLEGVQINVDGVGYAITPADGSYAFTGLAAGSYTATAYKDGHTTASTTVTVPGNATWNPVLGTRQLTVTPATGFTVRLAPNKTATRSLALKSTGSLPVAWTASSPWYTWLTRTPAGGTLAPGASKNVSLAFNTAGMTYGTYYQYLSINSDDMDSPYVDVQVTLEVASAKVPVVQPLNGTTAEDAPITLAFSGSDADNDPLQYEIQLQPLNGTLSYVGGGSLDVTYTPNPDFSGTDSFTYRAFDGFHYSAPATVSVTVTPVNDLPVLKQGAIVLTGPGSRTITLQVTDVDSPSVTISLAGQPAHGTATLVGTQLTYTLTGTFLGADAIPLTLDDGTESVAASVVVSVAHPSFTWTTLGNGSAHTGVAAGSLTNFAVPTQVWQQSFTGVVSSPAINNGLIYVSTGYFFTPLRLAAVTLAGGGVAWERDFGSGFSLNPPTAVGDAVYVQRGNHGGDSQMFKLDATTGDTIWSTPFYAQWEEYLAPCVANGKVYANGGYYGGLYAFDDATGVNDWFAGRAQYDDWTPAFANGRLFSWVDSSFAEHNLTDGSTLWEVTLPKQWGGYDMDTAPTVIGNVAIAIEFHSGALTAIDLTTKAVRFTRTNGYYGVASGSGNNLFAYSATGVDEINLTTGALIRSYPCTTVPESWSAGARQPIVLSDVIIFTDGYETVCYKRGNSSAAQWRLPSSGALALAGPYLVVTKDQQVTTFRLPNRVPVFAGSTSYTTPEDVAVSAGISDADKDPLLVNVVTPPSAGTLTTTATSWKFQPPANGSGTFSFTLSASDGVAVVNRSITVTVTPVNDAPVAQKQDLTRIGAGSLSVTLTATDVDSSPLTYQVATQPANGTLTGTAPALTYAPKAGFTGVDSFTFTASDGALTSAAAKITINVLQSLPAPWQTLDVGTVGKTGLAGYDPTNQAFTVQGAGADIWGTADGFRFVHRSLAGDGQIVARVASQTNTNAWAKAGVMMRESTATGSRYAALVVSPTNGVAFQRRTATGGTTVSTTKTGYAAPAWVKLIRKGNLVSSFVSTDGATWTPVGSATVTMGATLSVGLAVTSHTTSMLSTAVFDRVSVAAAFTTQLNIDFTPVDSELNPYFVPDHGAVFGLRPIGRDYGWNAVNNSTRDRNMLPYGPDASDTLIHMQKAPLTNAVWEIAVPDGMYHVHIGFGDAAFFDSVYHLIAEGQVEVGATPSTEWRLFEWGGDLQVTDGRLTLTNGPNAVNNKATHIMIIPIPSGDG